MHIELLLYDLHVWFCIGFMPDPLCDAAFPFYLGLGSAPSLACGWVTRYK